MRKKCLEMVYELAKKNKKIIFIGSDLGAELLSIFKSCQINFLWRNF